METDIISQVKNIFAAGWRDFPCPCDAWADVQPVIQLYQPVEKLVGSPDDGLVTRKCRVECAYIGGFIVPENRSSRILITISTGKQQDQGKNANDLFHGIPGKNISFSGTWHNRQLYKLINFAATTLKPYAHDT
jgi:hypothetical protein